MVVNHISVWHRIASSGSLNALDCTGPAAIRFIFPLNSIMLANFLKTTFRNFVHHKSFSIINVLGLALGLTACLLIGLFVRDEEQFDRFIPGADRIYRVYQQPDNDATAVMGLTPPAFATALKENYPEVEKVLRVMRLNSKELFETGNKKIYEEGGFIADSNFFELFPLPLKYGSSKKVLDAPNSIIISEGMSRRFFGDADPVGKTIS